jgi:hypothetical protein
MPFKVIALLYSTYFCRNMWSWVDCNLVITCFKLSLVWNQITTIEHLWTSNRMVSTYMHTWTFHVVSLKTWRIIEIDNEKNMCTLGRLNHINVNDVPPHYYILYPFAKGQTKNLKVLRKKNKKPEGFAKEKNLPNLRCRTHRNLWSTTHRKFRMNL